MGLREIRARNLRKYSPEAVQAYDQAFGFRARLPVVVCFAVLIGFTWLSTVHATRVIGLVGAACTFVVLTVVVVRWQRGQWRSLATLRQSRLEYQARVRQWAAKNGHPLSPTSRIPTVVLDAYNAANPSPRS